MAKEKVDIAPLDVSLQREDLDAVVAKLNEVVEAINAL